MLADKIIGKVLHTNIDASKRYYDLTSGIEDTKYQLHLENIEDDIMKHLGGRLFMINGSLDKENKKIINHSELWIKLK